MTRPVPTSTVVTTVGESLTVVVVPLDATHATVQLDGDFDLLCADGVTQVFRDQVHLGRRFVTVDLSRLTFVNSAGLRVLALAHNDFLAARGALVLAGVTSRTAQLLAITSLDTALFFADAPGELPPARHLISVDTMTSPSR